MEQSEKLDLILDKLENIEASADKEKLRELAKAYWKLTDDDIALIELSRRILDRGGKDNDDKTLTFAMDISDVINRYGVKGVMRVLTMEMKPAEMNKR